MRIERIPAAALAACLVGLILCPWVFVANGALSGFSPAFSFVMLPPFLLGGILLLRHFLSKPKEPETTQSLSWFLEALSWVVVVAFLYLISGVNLMKGLERLGAVCTFFLATSAGCLPILLLRPTIIERRLARLPRRVSVIALILIVIVSGIAMLSYLTTPPTFVG